MYDLPPRRRISLILVKLGPAHALDDTLLVMAIFVKANAHPSKDVKVPMG